MANNIIVKNSGQAALDYLSKDENAGNTPFLELIFLDINMPGMNGWSFSKITKNWNRSKRRVSSCACSQLPCSRSG
ncbi:MAG: hypothetical protein IPM82_31125 [Saprospiraceae bacterium]|nr:hypothetical protein [Saprospiraceae bacterium]